MKMNLTADRVIFFEDGVLDSCCKFSPQQVLLKHIAGVYTTVLITPEGTVIDWVLHRNRLLRGIEILNKRPTGPFQSFLSSLETEGSSLSEFFSRQVVPAVKTALSAFYVEEQAAITQPPSQQQPLIVCPQPHHQQEPQSLVSEHLRDPRDGLSLASSSVLLSPAGSQSPQHAMLMVCISPAATTAGRDARSADCSAASSDMPAKATSSPSVVSFSPTPGPGRVVLEGCTTGHDRVNQGGGGGGGRGVHGADLSKPCGQCSRYIHIAVYCKAAQPPLYGPDHGVQAAVMGRPRSLPGAKASSWVEERRQYEERKPPEASEVLLSDAGGRILEGLVTNFCVISITAPSATSTVASTTTCISTYTSTYTSIPTAAEVGSSSYTETSAEQTDGTGKGDGEEEVVLRVCGPQADAALPGVVQARVVEAANRLGLRVVPEPPLAGERHTWREAFISNCIKRIQPLSRVFCPPGNAWGADPWDYWLPYTAGKYTTALLRELELIQERTPWRDL
ncbi:hypothetical protein Vretimale_1105 [Volvox reticuliferus]|uniref:Uncharacterized protein n=1 Tax=Volvox reticuliferus TaxID=1737510 RepID=A0A8J4D3D7_9CHLO|nr:hypothetical protein Vretimale_1105 [Volvox reticuliferus]